MSDAKLEAHGPDIWQPYWGRIGFIDGGDAEWCAAKCQEIVAAVNERDALREALEHHARNTHNRGHATTSQLPAPGYRFETCPLSECVQARALLAQQPSDEEAGT